MKTLEEIIKEYMHEHNIIRLHSLTYGDHKTISYRYAQYMWDEACKAQRVVCAKEARATDIYKYVGRELKMIPIVDKDSILNATLAPYPKQ